MGTKHIHAEVIKAWADGEEIEMFIASIQQWHHAQTPMWDTTTRYRVKPKNIVVKRAVRFNAFSDCVYDFNDSVQANIEYTFSPEGKLISAKAL
jgi:hypothetical protein